MPLIERLRVLGLYESSDEERNRSKIRQFKREVKAEEKAAAKKARKERAASSVDSAETTDEGDEDDDEDDVDDSVVPCRLYEIRKSNLEAKTEAQALAGKECTERDDASTSSSSPNNNDDDDNNDDDNNRSTNGATTPEPATPNTSFPNSDYVLSDRRDDYAASSCGSDMSELEIRADERVRTTVSNAHGFLSVLGRADCLQQRSAGKLPGGALTAKVRLRNGRRPHYQRPRVPPQPCVVELEYPTGDDDAADKFRVWGFKDGLRVYRLESPLLPMLRKSVVKTAVGLCYIDIPSMCPPTIVTVPANDAAAVATAADDASFATASTPTSNTASETLPRPTSADTPGTPDTPQNPVPPPILQVNGMFEVRPSALGGLGCFAMRDIFRGEHLLVERPLVRTNMMHLIQELARLSTADRAQFDALTGHHPDPRASRDEQIWTANTFVAGELDSLFIVASRFNHACSASPSQNVGYRYDRHQDVLTLTAVGRIAKGTELLISYGKSRRMLFERFGFWCRCSGCGGDQATEMDGGNMSDLLTQDMYNRIVW
ncbi:uncharacterized protein SPSK_00023 [Sporothrix schenckii 1099-18]|uniref:SET domain-containing protein n=1 Tax=Sporothrix schenckii 1099-18 TaxID=1397361 RepID=A0A0F2LVC3_SPOSC|nr:uncharacterized protein SPSK_00023 [Sporothrix schenckii 1099-18]KJR79846.1 hypothetical protein SPSK_00023 [Sporothrix schenckii 1099-18]